MKSPKYKTLAAILGIVCLGWFCGCSSNGEDWIYKTSWEVHSEQWSGIVDEYKPKDAFIWTPCYRDKDGRRVKIPSNAVMIEIFKDNPQNSK